MCPSSRRGLARRSIIPLERDISLSICIPSHSEFHRASGFVSQERVAKSPTPQKFRRLAHHPSVCLCSQHHLAMTVGRVQSDALGRYAPSAAHPKAGANFCGVGLRPPRGGEFIPPTARCFGARICSSYVCRSAPSQRGVRFAHVPLNGERDAPRISPSCDYLSL